MPTDEHYFIEQTGDEQFAVRAKGSERTRTLFETQEEAIAQAKKQNPNDLPDVERVRNTETAGPDKYESRQIVFNSAPSDKPKLLTIISWLSRGVHRGNVRQCRAGNS